jgi:signal transduction histidine kinase
MQTLLTKVSEFNDLRASFGIVAGHELRTPLTVIQGHAELLLHGHFGELDRQQTESVRNIRRSVSLMASQVTAYLDLIALREGRLVLHPTICDLKELISEAMALWGCEAHRLGLSLQVDVSEPARVFADSRRLRQVIDQVMSNAMTVTPVGGIVRITVQNQVRHAVLQVEDTGPGIAPADLARAFDDLAPQDHDGLGIGLALAKALASAMNGWIAYAAAPAGGAIVSCGFPLPDPVRGGATLLAIDPGSIFATRQVLDSETGLWKVVPDQQMSAGPQAGITLAQVVYDSPSGPASKAPPA